MWRDQQYLQDIIDAAEAISSFAVDYDENSFISTRLVCSAILHELTVIGEAAGRVSEETRERHPKVPWRKAAAFRNIIAHEYFGLNLKLVWQTAIQDISLLRSQIVTVIAAEFPEQSEEP